MKIGIDARPLISDNPTGVGVYLANIMEYIALNDTENNYILYTNISLSSKYSFPKNITVKIIKGKVGTLWLRYMLPKQIKIDAIDVFWGTQHILPRKVDGIRYVLTVHDLALLVNPRWGSCINGIMQNVFARMSIKNADRIIAVSNSTKSDIVRICHFSENKVSVVYEGVEYNHLEQTVNDNSVLSKFNIEKKYYLYLGTLEPRKNIDTIVRAFELIASFDDNVILVLAGGMGWKFKHTLKYIKNSPYKERIIFTGYVSESEKEALLKNCICFLFPSHYEGFGIPVLEAFAMSAFVITSSGSSLPEVGGDAAFYVESENDAEALSKIMYYVQTMTGTEKMDRIQKGLDQVSRFKWSECGQKTLSLILREE